MSWHPVILRYSLTSGSPPMMGALRWGKHLSPQLSVVAEISNTKSQNEVHGKIKIRISKFETIFKILNSKDKNLIDSFVLVIKTLVFRICFVFRASYFEFLSCQFRF